MKGFRSLICALLLIFVFSGCGTGTLEENSAQSKTGNNVVYENGELAYVETECGNYYFGVTEAKILPATANRDAVYQITWEYHNESFSTDDGKLLGISEASLTVTDSNGYVVTPMSMGWKNDWANEYATVNIGNKCIAKHTFVINDLECDYLDVLLNNRGIQCRIVLTSNTDEMIQESIIDEKSEPIQIEDVWYEMDKIDQYVFYLTVRNISGENLSEVLPSIDVVNDTGDIVGSTSAVFDSVLDDGQACTIESAPVELTTAPYGIRISSSFITDVDGNLEEVIIDPAIVFEGPDLRMEHDGSSDTENEEEPSTEAYSIPSQAIEENNNEMTIQVVEQAYQDALASAKREGENQDYEYHLIYCKAIWAQAAIDDGGIHAANAEFLFGPGLSDDEIIRRTADILTYVVDEDGDPLSALMKKFKTLSSVYGTIEERHVDIEVKDIDALLDELGIEPVILGRILAMLDMYDGSWLSSTPEEDKILKFTETGFTFQWDALSFTEYSLKLT